VTSAGNKAASPKIDVQVSANSTVRFGALGAQAAMTSATKMQTFPALRGRSPKVDVQESANSTVTFPRLHALVQYYLPRRRLGSSATSSRMQARTLLPSASILIQRAARHWSAGRDPENIEDLYLLWGMPKIVWVIIFDVLAVSLYVAGIKGVTYLARKRPEPDIDASQECFNK